MVAGKRVQARLYSGRLRLENDRTVATIPLHLTDKRVAQQKLGEIVKEREREAAGISVPRVIREAMQKPLSDHVAAFLGDLKGKARASRTIKSYRNLLENLFRQCRWLTLRDFNPRSFCEWRSGSELRPKSLNDYHGALLNLCNWLERQGVLSCNPFKHVQKVSNDGVGRYRRALSAAEVVRLLAVAPPSRGWVYLVIIYTGLRRHELNRLTWGHFHLDAAQPHVELPGTLTKNRKSDCQPLRAEVVQALIQRRPEMSMPYEWVFRGKVPAVSKLKRDLAAAGIPVVDDRGRVVDLHALRTTFGTMLSVAGVSPRVAMELMRHSDLKLTMRIYTDAAQLPLASDVQRLPSFSVPQKDAQRHSQIHAQTTVAASVSGSCAVALIADLAIQ